MRSHRPGYVCHNAASASATACNSGQAIQNLTPTRSFVARRVQFPAAGTKVDTGRIEGVCGHAVAQDRLIGILLRHSATQSLPGPACISRAVDAHPGIRADTHLSVEWKNVRRVGIVGMDDHREAEVGRHTVGDFLPAIAGIIAAKKSAVILKL